MKSKNFLPILILSLTVLFVSCKKEDTDTTQNDMAATVSMTTDQAIADNLTEDANDIMLGVAEEQNLNGFKGDGPTVSNFVCATVTVTPASGFPKTITIDFGPLPGCTDSFGITRSGIIQVVITDSLRHPGSTATMTFNNYFVMGYKKEGTIIWTNTSSPGVRSWSRQVQNGKITAPNGNWWLHNGMKQVVQIAGVNTPIRIDDVFRITGNGNTTNANGLTRSHLITEPLQKKHMCPWIDKGRIRFEGPNHFAILDFGDGQCNRAATISIDGQPPHQILLP